MMCFVLDSFCRFSLSFLFFPLSFKIGFGGHAMDSRIRRIRVRRCAMTGNGCQPPQPPIAPALPCNVPPRPGNGSFWTPRELSHIGFAQRCDHAIPYLLTKGTPVYSSLMGLKNRVLAIHLHIVLAEYRRFRNAASHLTNYIRNFDSFLEQRRGSTFILREDSYHTTANNRPN